MSGAFFVAHIKLHSYIQVVGEPHKAKNIEKFNDNTTDKCIENDVYISIDNFILIKDAYRNAN